MVAALGSQYFESTPARAQTKFWDGNLGPDDGALRLTHRPPGVGSAPLANPCEF